MLQRSNQLLIMQSLNAIKIHATGRALSIAAWMAGGRPQVATRRFTQWSPRLDGGWPLGAICPVPGTLRRQLRHKGDTDRGYSMAERVRIIFHSAARYNYRCESHSSTSFPPRPSAESRRGPLGAMRKSCLAYFLLRTRGAIVQFGGRYRQPRNPISTGTKCAAYVPGQRQPRLVLTVKKQGEPDHYRLVFHDSRTALRDSHPNHSAVLGKL